MKTFSTDRRVTPARFVGGSWLAAAALLAASPASGADIVWTGNGATANWSDGANWSTGAPPGYGVLNFAAPQQTTSNNDYVSAEYLLVFTGTSAYTLNGRSINLYDNGGAQSKIETNAGANASGPVTFNMAMNFAATTGNNWGEINAVTGDLVFNAAVGITGSAVAGLKDYGSGHTLTFNAAVTGGNKYVELRGGNTAVFNADNQYTGGTYVNNGSTAVFNATQTANDPANNFVRLGGDTSGGVSSTGATLALGNAAGGVTLSAGVNTVANAGGTLLVHGTNRSGTNTVAGNVYLDAPLTVSADTSGGTLAFTGTDFQLKQQPLTVTGAGTVRIGNPITNYSSSSNGVTVAMAATGKLVLDGDSSYRNGTTVSSGTLLANNGQNTGTSPTGVGGVDVMRDATFAGNGRIAGNVYLYPGGVVSAGTGSTASDTPGTLSTNRQTWSGGSAYAFKIANTLGTAGSTTGWDELSMSTLSLAADASNKFLIRVIGLGYGKAFTTGQLFEIANVRDGVLPTAAELNTMTGKFTLDTSSLGIPSGDFSLVGGAAQAGEDGADLFLSYNGAGAQSSPEPGVVLLGGLAATPLLGRRARRRRDAGGASNGTQS